MIKEIIFKNTKDFSAKSISLSLAPNVNVIIGPKGGGKSTLFDLIAGLKNNYISENVIKALESYHLKFEKAIKYSNEEILFSQLSKKKKKEKEEDYNNRNDVIYQDDKIKKDLTSTKEIEDQKFTYAKKQIEISEDVNKLILEIRNLYLSMNKVNDYFKNELVNINWTNTFKMKDLVNNNQLDLITKLDYKPINLSKLIEEELKEYQNFFIANEEYENKIKKLKLLDKTKIINDQNFAISINEMIEKIIKDNKDLINLIKQRELFLKRINMFSNSFYKAYRKTIEKIKTENYASGGLKSYEIQAKNYFKNLAHDLFNVIKYFENLNAQETILNIENDSNQKSVLYYQIPQNLVLDDETKIEILKTVFHSPGNSKEDVTKWLKSLTEKGIKDFKEETIKNCLAREIKNEVKVLVDFGNEKKEYEALSLGQKSIYGLKYKFNKSINEDLYLDQPEDNLDNHTIAEEILPMLNQKDNNQVIIVTHNANIGILSNPQRVIIADLNNYSEPYKITEIEEVINENSAHYLEGGKEYLKQRYCKIVNQKGDK